MTEYNVSLDTFRVISGMIFYWSDDRTNIDIAMKEYG